MSRIFDALHSRRRVGEAPPPVATVGDGPEPPILGYEKLDVGQTGARQQIAEALPGADAENVKASRDCARRFRHRPEAREARVRAGFTSRRKTARDLAG